MKIRGRNYVECSILGDDGNPLSLSMERLSVAFGDRDDLLATAVAHCERIEVETGIARYDAVSLASVASVYGLAFDLSKQPKWMSITGWLGDGRRGEFRTMRGNIPLPFTGAKVVIDPHREFEVELGWSDPPSAIRNLFPRSTLEAIAELSGIELVEAA